MEKALTGLVGWLDARLPVTRAWDTHMGKYYAPKNFNFWYVFGILASVVLVNQLLTGVWLTMNYEPSGDGAFASVEYIMRDVDYGWLLRYMHLNVVPGLINILGADGSNQESKSKYIADHLHPNDEGHRYIHSLLQEELSLLF
jgi:hypothetical protein